MPVETCLDGLCEMFAVIPKPGPPGPMIPLLTMEVVPGIGLGKDMHDGGGLPLSRCSLQNFIDLNRRYAIDSPNMIIMASAAVCHHISKIASDWIIRLGAKSAGIEMDAVLDECMGPDVGIIPMPLWDFLGRDDLMASIRMDRSDNVARVCWMYNIGSAVPATEG